MLERLSLNNDVSLVASSPLQERITQQEFLFSTSVHSDKNKICIRERDSRRIKMCAGERLPYFNFFVVKQQSGLKCNIFVSSIQNDLFISL